MLEHKQTKKRRDHASDLKMLGDQAAEILQLHRDGKIDADEAARRLNELKTKDRSFLDLLVG
jgi:hypothetical protein